MSARRWVMAERPHGKLETHHLNLVDAPREEIGDGEIEIENIFVSIDPTTRLWMSDVSQHAQPMQLGDPIRSFVWGRVKASRNKRHREGDMVFALGAWESVSRVRHATAIPESHGLPLSAHASVLGLTGLTAYFGMLDVGRPQAGETVVVSAAGGAVGSVAAQIGRILGCRTVGIVGSEAKAAKVVHDYRLDAAVSRQGDLSAALANACPSGIDVDFENVAGPVLDAVMEHINPGARLVLCGMISAYESDGVWPANVVRPLLMKRARLEGVLISAYFNRLQEGVEALAGWVKSGEMRWDVDVLNGLERAPEALQRVLSGANIGKQLVQLAPDPWA